VKGATIMTTRAPQAPARYSLLGLLDGGQYESGLAELAAQRYGAPQLRGQALPHGPLLRDLGMATASGGGNLGATDLAAVAAAVRPLLVLDQLGAARFEVSGVAELALPRFDGGVGAWISEGEQAGSMSTTVQSATATARCAAARLGLSRRVRNANRADVEGAVLAEIERAVRNTIEQGFIQGVGADSEPLGLLNVPGVGSKAFAAATPSWAELIDMIELLGDADGDLTRAHWLMHPSMLANLMAVLIDPNGGELAVAWSSGAHRIAGIPIAISSNVPEAKVLLADFSTVQTVYFGSPAVIDDQFSGGRSINGSSELVVMNHCDVVVREPAVIVLGSA
jgi:HK97 family phage major capsid protein